MTFDEPRLEFALIEGLLLKFNGSIYETELCTMMILHPCCTAYFHIR
jgi:hypothetical protein